MVIPMSGSNQTVYAVGLVTIAVIIAIGFFLLLYAGKPTDGLETGFVAVLGFFFGGTLVHTALATMADKNIDATSNAVQTVERVAHTAVVDASDVGTNVENGPPGETGGSAPNNRIVGG